jgi:hypothetical protein
MGTYIKKSFGTALKLVDARHPAATSAMVVAAVLMLLLAPSTGTFVEGISSRSLWAGLQERLLPQERWFGVFVERGRLAAVPAEAPPQATGSLPASSNADTSGRAAP